MYSSLGLAAGSGKNMTALPLKPSPKEVTCTVRQILGVTGSWGDPDGSQHIRGTRDSGNGVALLSEAKEARDENPQQAYKAKGRPSLVGRGGTGPLIKV